MMAQAAFTSQVCAQGIVIDGRMQTEVGQVGYGSAGMTFTVSGSSGFNSCSSFQMGHQMLHRTEEPRSVRVDASLVLALF